ncbi:MAG: helix-turn-helix transcriptional regulator [Rhizobiales bacterium]|nr:helix-turn-helix transcriptional regulator [Hyphomicrobiales bacterium]
MRPAPTRPLAEPDSAAMLLARDIRALRRARGLTLAEMALRLGRSIGWVSQVERGLSQPAIEDLRRLAGAFGVPLSMFFSHDAATEAERGVVVRAGHRRSLGSTETGLTEELLSPDLGGAFELIRSEFAPGAERSVEVCRDTEDAGYVVSGRFDIEIGGVWHSLGEGDSFRFSNRTYRWRNPGSEPAVVIWAVSPPVY